VKTTLVISCRVRVLLFISVRCEMWGRRQGKGKGERSFVAGAVSKSCVLKRVACVAATAKCLNIELIQHIWAY